MSDIIVAGYPKSGSTWIIRLVAELVGCPITGFWNRPEEKEMAVEGAERVSAVRCYKAHQPFPELAVTPSASNSPRLLYVVRDPRDVVVSGSHFFSFNCHAPVPLVLQRWLAKHWTHLQRWTRREIQPPWLLNQQQRQAWMIKAMIEGDALVPWLQVPWADHVSGYLRAGVPFVRYEDMRAAPDRECARLLAQLGIERDAAAIRQAVERHEFKNEKARFIQTGEKTKSSHMRQGRAGEWRTALSTAQQVSLSRHWGDLLRQLKYTDLPVGV